MKTVKAHTKGAETTTYYIDSNNDIFGTREDAEICGVVGCVVVDAWHIGTLEDQANSALVKYQAGI